MLSVNILHKNDMLNLFRAVRSVVHIADEIIIVDSGGHDYTQLTRMSCKIKIIRYIGEFSFGKARNMAIEQSQGNWILILDSDEVLSLGQDEKLRMLMRCDPYNAFAFIVVNYFNNGLWANFPITKLFCRIDNEIAYEKDIHETVNYSLSKKNVVPDIVDIYIDHYGYTESNERLLAKQAHYVGLLTEQIKKTPEDPASYWHLSASYKALGMSSEAYTNIDNAIRLEQDNKIPYIFKSRFLMQDAQYEQAIDLLKSAITMEKGAYWNPTMYNLLGMAYIMLNEIEIAKSFICLAMQGKVTMPNHYVNLALCHYKLGQTREAMNTLEYAAYTMPQLLSLKTNLGTSNPFAFQEDVSSLFTGLESIYNALVG